MCLSCSLLGRKRLILSTNRLWPQPFYVGQRVKLGNISIHSVLYIYKHLIILFVKLTKSRFFWSLLHITRTELTSLLILLFLPISWRAFCRLDIKVFFGSRKVKYGPMFYPNEVFCSKPVVCKLCAHILIEEPNLKTRRDLYKITYTYIHTPLHYIISM